MQLPPITTSQKKIIFFLYKFRFLLICQTQQFFHHKDSKRVKEWLKDLVNKKYINVIKDTHDRTKPYVFCLAQQAAHILKEDEDINKTFLYWLYKEKDKSEVFIQRNLFVVNAYLYFLKNKLKKSELQYFTKQDLTGYTYFPDPLPDAYIDVKEGKEHTRYFLDYFEADMPLGYIRYRVRYYVHYCEEGNWQKNTDNTPFPILLLVFDTEKRKRYISHYAQSLLEKSFTHDVEVFLTSKDNITFGKENTNIWQKVEVPD